jgi:hypothetical protein
MKLDAKLVMPWIVAVVVLAVVVAQTAEALRQSGVWRSASRVPAVRTVDPYDHIERALARVQPAIPPGGLRNPLAFGFVPITVVGHPEVSHPRIPPPPPQPVLTSIVWDNDPRATVRWNSHDYSVRRNSLFADFRVLSISRDEVVLESGKETLRLKLPRKGE